ncbi:MAG: SsrA-binding protein SmpB [Myxococcota bacterium]
MSAPDLIQDLVVNRKARHEYLLLDTFEAGLALVGSEVKSLRAGQGNLQEAYVRIEKGEIWLINCHISPFKQASINNHEPTRRRKLLLNRTEINKIEKGVGKKGMTIVALRIYLKGRRIKMEIALGKGKKLHDKRQTMKARDAKRDLERGR